MSSDDATIRSLIAEFVCAFNDGDVDRMMRVHPARYVDVNLPRPEQTQAERTDYYRRIVARRDLRVEVRVDEIIVDGAHANVRGSIRLSRVDVSTVRELRYMELWERLPDGWKSIWGIDGDVHE